MTPTGLDLASIGFQRAQRTWEPTGEMKELWTKPTANGPIVISVTYPKARKP